MALGDKALSVKTLGGGKALSGKALGGSKALGGKALGGKASGWRWWKLTWIHASDEIIPGRFIS